MLKKIREKRELISYIIVGGLTTLLSWAVYAACVKWLGMSVFWGNAVSWVIAVLFAYFTNKFFVFRIKSMELKLVLREFALFISARAASGVFEIVMVPLLVKLGLNTTILGVEGALSKGLVTVVVIIMNYFLSKYLIFIRPKS